MFDSDAGFEDRLEPREPTEYVHNPDGWTRFSHDPDTGKERWIKFEGDKAIVRDVVPWNVLRAMFDMNTAQANNWSGWRGKDSAMVARIPEDVHHDMKVACGYDPKVGGEFDRTKYRRMLNDRDFAKFRTGGGTL